MEEDAPMMFYNGDYRTLVDVYYGETEAEINVAIYPHTPVTKDIGILLEGHEDRLRELLKELPPGRTGLTIDAETLVPITEKDFQMYAEHPDSDYYAFIFDTEDDTRGFPWIWMVAKSTLAGIYENLFRIQRTSSHWNYKSVKPTYFGKKTAYVLLNAFNKGKFLVPHISFDQIKLPSNGRDGNSLLDTKALTALFEKAGVSRLVQSEKGIVLKEDVNEIPSTDIVPYVSQNDLKSHMLKQFVQKNTVSLTSLCEYGVAETLQLFPGKNLVIPIEMDVPGGMSRACLYEGKVHIIPKDPDFDFEMIFEDDSHLVIHTDADSYPKMTPTLE